MLYQTLTDKWTASKLRFFSYAYMSNCLRIQVTTHYSDVVKNQSGQVKKWLNPFICTVNDNELAGSITIDLLKLSGDLPINLCMRHHTIYASYDY